MISTFSKLQQYHGYDELVRLVLEIRIDAEKKYRSPKTEKNPYYFPKHPTLIYENLLIATTKGLAPIGLKKFSSWENWVAYKQAKKEEMFNEDPDHLPSGYIYISYELPFWKDEGSPYFFSISTFQKDSDFDKDLIMSCHNCKFSLGVPVNHKNTGNLCAKYQTQAMYESNLPISQQSYYFSFPMYPNAMVCPEFLWRRENTTILKSKLKEAKHPEQCFFCKEGLKDINSDEVIIHHKKPIEEGGGHNVKNLEFAHNYCHDEYHRNNSRKRNKS